MRRSVLDRCDCEFSSDDVRDLCTVGRDHDQVYFLAPGHGIVDGGGSGVLLGIAEGAKEEGKEKVKYCARTLRHGRRVYRRRCPMASRRTLSQRKQEHLALVYG